MGGIRQLNGIGACKRRRGTDYGFYARASRMAFERVFYVRALAVSC